MSHDDRSHTVAVPGFTLGEKLGEGGMGIVYRATDAEFGRPVAVKVMKADRPSPDAVRRFLDEARITGRLQHPGVPAAYRLGVLADGRPFMAMKLIEGRTFADRLRDRDDPGEDLPTHLHVFEQVCQTVAYAHGEGMIHRDLKPSNVMVGAFGEVQVMDWGLANELAPASRGPLSGQAPVDALADAPGSPGVTQGETDMGQVVGTPAYMSPEQALGRDEVGARSDVFALGAMLCEILTGEAPYAGPYALVAAREANLTEAHALLDACGADGDLVTMARRCLSADPADRPADSGAVAEAIAAYRLGVEQRLREAEQARAAAVARASEQAKRQRVQRWLTAAVLLLLSGGGAFAWYADRQATRHAARGDSAREALDAAFGQAEKSLREDSPEEAAIALVEASRRLEADAHADPAGDRAARLADLQEQLAFLRDLDRIRDDLWSYSEGKFYDRDVARHQFSDAFRQRGLDLNPPTMIRARLETWAIREQVLGALDLWLSVNPPESGLGELLAVVDPDPARAAWRYALVRRDTAQQQKAVEQLLTGKHPPRFIAAHASTWPRDEGIRLLRGGWNQLPNNLPLTFSLALVLQGERSTLGEAVTYYRVCRGLRPRHTSTLNNLGIALKDQDDLDGAIAAYRQAIAIDPKSAGVFLNLGVALEAKRDLDGALAACRQAIAISPKYATAYNNLGAVLKARDDLDGAIAAHRQAVAIDSKRALFHFNLGVALKAKNDLDGAVVAYRKAVEINPRYAEAFNNLGVALKAKNDHDGAIDAYRQAIAIDPKYARAFTNLGIALEGKKDFDGAVTAHRQAIAIDPRYALAYCNLGVALEAKKDLGGAIAAYRQAIAIDPKGALFHYNLGTVLAAKDDTVGAIDAFRQAIAADPKHAPAHYNLGLCLHDEGRFAEAVPVLQRAHELGSKQPGWRAPSERNLREARRLLDLDNRLPRLLEGAEESASALECVEFAQLCCFYRERQADALHLYEQAFRLDPALEADLTAGHRYTAASAAVLAAAGAGVHPPAETERPALRRRALAWLRADLTAWRGAPRASAVEGLGDWLTDPDLATVREAAARAKLPDDERRAWEAFWDNVRRTLDEIQPKAP